MKESIARWSDGPFALAFVAVAAVVLAALAFTRPTTTTSSREVLYTQSGAFVYEAESARPALFDTGKAATGDPVFFRLSENVDFTFSYTFTADSSHALASTAALVAEVGESGGWKRTITLQEPVSFDGGAFELGGTLDLAQVRALTDAFTAETGVAHPVFSVTILADIRSNAQVAGEAVELAFAPHLRFGMDDAQLRLDTDAGGDASTMLKPAEDGFVRETVEVPARIGLSWLDATVATARVVSLVGLFVAASGVAGLAWARRSASGAGPFSGEEGVVRVAAGSVLGTGTAIEVATFEGLKAVAEAEATVLFEEPARDGGFVYAVCAHGNTYVWRTGPPAGANRKAELA